MTEFAFTVASMVNSQSILFPFTPQRLHNLEDPYLRQRDSRTDITIRKSTVRRRDPHDLESDYLPTHVVKPQANGASKSKAAVDYYNTSPSGSQPNKVCYANYSYLFIGVVPLL